ncbi:pheromone receptor [Mycena floridula]|nr:pheromone receptor [Mycena floridula]
MTLSNNVFSIFAFSSFIITSIPVWWLLKSSNIPACFYLFWLAAPCLTLGINSVIWNGSLVNYAPVWCDITTRILIASTFGLPACCLAIYRRLYLICSSRSAGQTSTIGVSIFSNMQYILYLFADLGICLGIPLFGLVLRDSGHRFDIIEDFGCRAFTYLTPVAFVLVLVPPLILGLISGIYGYLCIRLLIRERREMLKTSKTQGHISDSTDYILYKRLMLMAALEIVLDVPLSIYVIYANAAHGVSPWISWEDTHYNFSRVGLIPASLWRNVPEALVSTEFDRWTYIALSIISFLAFGFTQQAFEHYRIFFRSLCRLRRSDKEDKEIPSPYW